MGRRERLRIARGVGGGARVRPRRPARSRRVPGAPRERAVGARRGARALATSLVRRQGQVFVYAILGYAVETTDQDAVARFGRAQSVQAQVDAALAFVDPELLALGRERLAEWRRPRPRSPRTRITSTTSSASEAHTRSAEVEEVLGLVGDVFAGPYAIYSALVDSDLAFAPAIAARRRAGRGAQGTIEALLRATPTGRCDAARGRATPTATSASGTPSPRTSRTPSSRMSSGCASAATARRSRRRSPARTSPSRCSTT